MPDAPPRKAKRAAAIAKRLREQGAAATPEMKQQMRHTTPEGKKAWRQAMKKARGRPPSKGTKQPVSIRLDPDVLDHYKSKGPGWQGRINAILRRRAKLGPRKDKLGPKQEP